MSNDKGILKVINFKDNKYVTNIYNWKKRDITQPLNFLKTKKFNSKKEDNLKSNFTCNSRKDFEKTVDVGQEINRNVSVINNDKNNKETEVMKCFLSQNFPQMKKKWFIINYFFFISFLSSFVV